MHKDTIIMRSGAVSAFSPSLGLGDKSPEYHVLYELGRAEQKHQLLDADYNSNKSEINRIAPRHNVSYCCTSSSKKLTP